MKTCFKCNESKPLTDFYPHPQMADGRLNKCKSCAKADAEARRAQKEQDPVWQAAELERHRIKSQRMRDEGRAPIVTPEKRLMALRRTRAKHPGKAAARAAAAKIPKQPCEVCGDPKTQKHHDDYSKPLEVRHLCTKHHAEHHVAQRRAKLLNPTK